MGMIILWLLNIWRNTMLEKKLENNSKLCELPDEKLKESIEER